MPTRKREVHASTVRGNWIRMSDVEPPEPHQHVVIDAKHDAVDFLSSPQARRGNPPYWLQLDACRHHDQFLGLIHHMCGKRWFTTDACQEFIEEVANHFGWDIFR